MKVDYATARRREEPISTAVTESTVQWLLHRRMNAQQQMRWSPRGAHLMLKVRTSVVNGTLNRDYAVAERWARRPFAERPDHPHLLDGLAANPRASTPSVMLNDKPDTEPANRPNSRYPRFDTVSRRTDAQDRSVGTMLLPTYSHCKRSTPPGTRACPTTYATIPPAKPSRSLSISTSTLSPQSCRPLAMGAIEEGRPAKKSP